MAILPAQDLRKLADALDALEAALPETQGVPVPANGQIAWPGELDETLHEWCPVGFRFEPEWRCYVVQVRGTVPSSLEADWQSPSLWQS